MEKKEYYDESDIKPKKWAIIIVIVITSILSIFLIYKVVDKISSKEWNIKNLFPSSKKSVLNNNFNKISDEYEKSSFNMDFENHSGSQSGWFINDLLDDVVDNNRKNNRLVSVIYKEYNTSNPDEIKDMKNLFEDSKKYYVTINYDSNGYVNEISIERFKNKNEAKSFNTKFEAYTGTRSGISIRYLFDSIVTNNKTNDDELITVNYKDVSTSVPDEIVNIKNRLDDWTDYEISVDYDEYGYIYQVNIK